MNTLSSDKLIKTETVKYIDAYLKQLENYKSLDSSGWSESENFTELVLKINKIIESNSKINDLFKNKQLYYKDKEEEINSIIRQILDDFKKALKNINSCDLENAKTYTIKNYSTLNLPIKIVRTETLFNRILGYIQIKHPNDEDEPLSAQQMIDYILNYELEFNWEDVIKNGIDKYIKEFIEKIEKLNMQWFYRCINTYIKYNSEQYGQESSQLINKLSQLLVLEPREKFVNEYIKAKAIILYFKLKGSTSFSADYPDYWFLIMCYMEDFITPLNTTLEQLKLSLIFPDAEPRLNQCLMNNVPFKEEVITALDLLEAQYPNQYTGLRATLDLDLDNLVTDATPEEIISLIMQAYKLKMPFTELVNKCLEIYGRINFDEVFNYTRGILEKASIEEQTQKLLKTKQQINPEGQEQNKRKKKTIPSLKINSQNITLDGKQLLTSRCCVYDFIKTIKDTRQASYRELFKSNSLPSTEKAAISKINNKAKQIMQDDDFYILQGVNKLEGKHYDGEKGYILNPVIKVYEYMEN